MNDGIPWLLVGFLLITLLLVIRVVIFRESRPSKKSFIIGLVVAAIIMISAVLYDLFRS